MRNYQLLLLVPFFLLSLTGCMDINPGNNPRTVQLSAKDKMVKKPKAQDGIGDAQRMEFDITADRSLGYIQDTG